MKKLIVFFKEFGFGIVSRKLMLYAAAGSYSFFLAIVPLMILLVALVQFLPLTNERILEDLALFCPEQFTSVLRGILEGIYEGRKAAFTISFILTIYSASAAMRAIMRGLDTAFNISSVSGFAKFYLRSFIYIGGFVFLLLISFFIMASGTDLLAKSLYFHPDNATLIFLNKHLKILRYLIVMIILYLSFLLLYTFMPSKRTNIRHQHPGAMLAAISWAFFSTIYALYLKVNDSFGAYGIIGTVMAAMMWMFFIFFFLLVGAWINYCIEHRDAIISGEETPSNVEN